MVDAAAAASTRADLRLGDEREKATLSALLWGKRPPVDRRKEQVRLDVPVGKVRFYDAEKGFGFLTKDEGGDVYVRANALPPGVTSLKAGQRVEFGVVEGRKGEQALSVHIVDVPPSLSKAHRKPPEQMTVIIEDLIKMLDGIGNGYRRGRYPDAKTSTKIATVLRAVADELEL
jgi:CspA family cold shock protein